MPNHPAPPSLEARGRAWPRIEALARLGGVGCLLRYETRATPAMAAAPAA